jgi:Protein of unknown function (DUF4231)
MTRFLNNGGRVASRQSATGSLANLQPTGREAQIDGGEAMPNADGPSKKAAEGYQHFWWKEEWKPAIPDTVLAHLDFRVKGQASCERKARWQGVSLIIIASLVPVAAAAQLSRWSIALLGALASMIAATGQLYGWKENAVREARSVMQIQRELVLWKNGTTPYRVLKTQPRPLDSWNHDDVLLSIRAENVVQSEGKGWATWFEEAERNDETATDRPKRQTTNNVAVS